MVTCRMILEFQMSAELLQLPEIQDDSSAVKWIDELSFVLYTCSKTGGHHLSFFQKTNDQWILVTRVESEPINVLSTVFEDNIMKHSSLILVGYANGKIEHLQTPLLTSTDFSQSLFPGMFALDNIDSFFKQVSVKSLGKPPQTVKLSPNGFVAEFLTGSGKVKIMDKVKFKCKVPLEDRKEDFVNRLSAMLFLGFIKNNDMEDFKIFLSDIPTSYAKLVSKKVCEIFSNHVSLQQNTLTSSFFSPELGNLEIDILSLLYLVHKSLNPDSWACRNAYLMIQLRFVKEMFLRASKNPIFAMEVISNHIIDAGNSLVNNYDVKQLSTAIEFRIGSYHQMAALVLWTKDFCNLLARHLYIYFSGFEEIHESCWVFLLDVECRKIIKEVITLAKVYQYHLRDLINSNSFQNEHVYLSNLERTIRLKKVSLENFLVFLMHADQILLHDEQMEREMHFDAILNNAFTPSIANLELYYQTLERGLYEMEIGTGFESSLLFTTPRILNKQIDNILLTNIPKNVKLQKCNRCDQETQVEMIIDPAIGRFGLSPSWSNSYSESCICGGTWIICELEV
jgi:hypothetical protein